MVQVGENQYITEFLTPEDARNVGLKCHICGHWKVVWITYNPAINFPAGAYCFKCLVNTCRASSRIPMPMEMNLLDKVQRELGIGVPGKKFYFVPELPK